MSFEGEAKHEETVRVERWHLDPEDPISVYSRDKGCQRCERTAHPVSRCCLFVLQRDSGCTWRRCAEDRERDIERKPLGDGSRARVQPDLLDFPSGERGDSEEKRTHNEQTARNVTQTLCPAI